MSLCPEDAAIKDVSKMQIDWLLDIKELEISADGYKSAAEADNALVSTFGLKSSFGEKSACF